MRRAGAVARGTVKQHSGAWLCGNPRGSHRMKTPRPLDRAHPPGQPRARPGGGGGRAGAVFRLPPALRGFALVAARTVGRIQGVVRQHYNHRQNQRSGRGLFDLPRFYRQLAARQAQLRALRIAPDDVIFTLAGITSLSNALASAYPGVFKVFAMPLKKYVDASLPADFRRYRHTTSSWLQNHLLEPLAGLRRTLHLKPWRSTRRRRGAPGAVGSRRSKRFSRRS